MNRRTTKDSGTIKDRRTIRNRITAADTKNRALMRGGIPYYPTMTHNDHGPAHHPNTGHFRQAQIMYTTNNEVHT
jgi:hypothetical protein